MTATTCFVCWGSHGCDRLAHADGDHICEAEDGSICSQVDQQGIDPRGLQWDLYGWYADGTPIPASDE